MITYKGYNCINLPKDIYLFDQTKKRLKNAENTAKTFVSCFDEKKQAAI